VAAPGAETNALKTDAELIRCVQAGDQAALGMLYRRYLPALWRYAYGRLGGDRHAAEDTVSETFLAAIDGLHDLDPEGGSVYGWLIGIARHKLADRARLMNRADRAGAVLAAEQGGHDSGGNPHSDLETAERRTRVAEAVDRLDDDHRLALQWKYLEGLSVREIAGRLGRSDRGAESLLYRARNALRQLLRDVLES